MLTRVRVFVRPVSDFLCNRCQAHLQRSIQLFVCLALAQRRDMGSLQLLGLSCSLSESEVLVQSLHVSKIHGVAL